MSRDFLAERIDETIRSELNDLLDTYHHFWDVPAELIQNAVDAVREKCRNSSEHKAVILVEIDAHSRSLRVQDNGVGINADKLDQFLVPGGGSKRKDPDSIGEKGVGLTYCIFSSNNFYITSRNGGQTCGGKIKQGFDWVREVVDDRPHIEPVEPAEYLKDRYFENFSSQDFDFSSGTEVGLEGVRAADADSGDIFDLNGNQLRWLLRTLTALGVTRTLWDDEYKPEFKAYYRFRLKGNDDWVSGELVVGYPRLHELVESMELEDVMHRLSGVDTRKEKTNILNKKAIWTRETFENKGKPIHVYGLMLPGNNVVRDLALRQDLIESHEDFETIGSDLLRNTIYMSTKGMPTGVEVPTPTKGKYPAYYKRCVFFVENDFYKFDMGRKSVNGGARKKLRDAVASVFQKMEVFAKFQGGEGADLSQPEFENPAERRMRIQEKWEQVKNLPPLNIDGVQFSRIPDKQEAGVAAIFHELLGARKLKRYRPLFESYSARYDSMCLYQNDSGNWVEVTIEFKHSLEALIRDLEAGRKLWDEIDALVCWDFDEKKLKESRVSVSKVDQADTYYEGVTHRLNLNYEGAHEIPVIVLSYYRS